jgi:hypothetical protein
LVISQTKVSTSFYDKLSYYNFALIKLTHSTERLTTTEVNILYRKERHLRLHSVYKSPSLEMDTTFNLSVKQLTYIEKFKVDMMNNSIANTDSIVYAGTSTDFFYELEDEIIQTRTKYDYSFIMDILKIK